LDGLDYTKQPHSAIGWARRCFMILRYIFSFGLLMLSWCVSWSLVLSPRNRPSMLVWIALFAASMFSTITVTVVVALPLVRIDTTESERQELRQKLVENGATLYGVSSCAYTQRQLADLGTTELFTQGLDYVDCEVKAAYCRQMNVTVYPTWQINGQLYPEYYSLEKLSEKLSGDNEVLDGLDLTKQPHSYIGWARQFFKIFRYTFTFVFLFSSWIMSWLVVLGVAIPTGTGPVLSWLK